MAKRDGKTRAAVLAALRSAREGPISGQDLAHRLGLSRTAVWKHIVALRESGYRIEAGPRRGYILAESPDVISPGEITAALKTHNLGHSVEFLPTVESTNTMAKERARAGAPEGLLVVADQQSGGRGRLGWHWLAPPGVSVLMSLLLRPTFPPHRAPLLTLAAAVAVCEAIQAVGGVPARIRWPNDILLQGQKCGGILTEIEGETDRMAFAVLGIGLNANVRPDQLPDHLDATSLFIARQGEPVSRVQLIRAILVHLEEGYQHLLAGRSATVVDRWRALSCGLGQTIEVVPPGGSAFCGLAEDIADDGALQVRLSSGEVQRVVSGDIRVLRAKPQPRPG